MRYLGDVMKKCYSCGRELPLSAFHKDKNSKDGYRSSCKQCRKKQMILYSDRTREQQKRYKAANKLKLKKQAREYYIKNK